MPNTQFFYLPSARELVEGQQKQLIKILYLYNLIYKTRFSIKYLTSVDMPLNKIKNQILKI